MTNKNKNQRINVTNVLPNRSAYSQKVNSLKYNIERYNQVIDDDLYDNSANSYLKTAGYIAEDLTLSIRNQIILQEQIYYNDDNKNNQIIDFDYTYQSFFDAEQCNNITILTMPPLDNIRHKQEEAVCGNKLLYDTLSEKLRRKFISRQLKTYKTKVVLAIFNVVSDENMEFQIPDTDNRNYHPIINIVKEFFISDDNYNNVSLYLDTIKLNTISKTVMFIIPIEKINTSCNSVVTMIQNYLYPNNSNNKIIKIDKNFRTNNVKNAVV